MAKSKLKNYAILGMGRYSCSIARGLAYSGCQVHAVDINEESVKELKDIVKEISIGDVTNKEFIESLGLSNFDAVIIGIGDHLEAGVVATVLVKEAGAKNIIAKSGSAINSKILKSIGADRVIVPEEEAGWKLANELANGHFFNTVEMSDTHSIVDFKVPNVWVGKSIIEIGIRQKYKVNVIGKRSGEQVSFNPSPNDPLAEGEVLIILGANADLEKMESKYDRKR